MGFEKPLYLKGFQPARRRSLGVFAGAGFVVAIVVVNYLVFFQSGGLAEPSLDQRLSRGAQVTDSAPVPDPVAAVPARPAPETRMVEGSIVKGETAVQALVRLGVSRTDAAPVVSALAKLVEFRTVKVGQKIALSLLPDGRMQSLTFPLNETGYIEVASVGGEWLALRKEIPTQKETVQFACMVRGSLYESLHRCGEDQALVPVVAELLGGQIDFFADGRRGDVLRISVEKESLSGRFLRYGVVKGVVYEGKLVSASAFPIEDGKKVTYFDADGNATERRFLRAPIKYTRLSSDYSLRRLHPILHTFVPHRAVDFAAPKGTPVYAAGDGKIVYLGPKGANGNLVVLDHEGGYQTYYAHLSHFQKGLKVGDRVDKRTLIAFVGSTGRSTGTHLHFAVAKNGEFIHPRKLAELKPGQIPANRLSDFKASAARVMGELKSLPVRGGDGSRS